MLFNIVILQFYFANEIYALNITLMGRMVGGRCMSCNGHYVQFSGQSYAKRCYSDTRGPIALAKESVTYECVALSEILVPSIYWTLSDRRTSQCEFMGEKSSLQDPKLSSNVSHRLTVFNARLFRLESQLSLPKETARFSVKCVVNTTDMCYAVPEPLYGPKSPSIKSPSAARRCFKSRSECYKYLASGNTRQYCPELSAALSWIPRDCIDEVVVLICDLAFYNSCNRTHCLPPCKEDCLLAKIRCAGVWQKLEEYGSDLIGASCHRLPHRYKGPCKSNLAPALWQEQSVDCYKPNVILYVGVVNVTKGGLPCQRWDSQCPNKHFYHPSIYSELKNAHNYCRTPGNRMAGPWCYKAVQNDRMSLDNWDYCIVPQCTHTVPDPVPPSMSVTISNPSHVHWYIYLFVAVCLLSLCVFLCKVKPWKRFLRPISKNESDGAVWYVSEPRRRLSEQNSYKDLVLEEQVALTCNSDYYDVPTAFEETNLTQVDPARLSFVRYLSEGAFGRVFVAKFDSNFVAVKTVKTACSRAHVLALAYETRVLNELGTHPNIVKVLGVCSRSFPPCLLLEYVAFGDLKSFLLNCVGDKENWINNDRLTDENLLWIIEQALDGLIYISSLGFIHRDLAARNCLLAPHLRLKICDFGSCRPAGPDGLHHGSAEEELPIRWLAPECLQEHVYSSASDVWAFGVLMWEVCSGGKQPYFGASDCEVVGVVCDGGRLSAPERGSVELWGLQLECWASVAEHRPSAGELKAKLDWAGRP